MGGHSFFGGGGGGGSRITYSPGHHHHPHHHHYDHEYRPEVRSEVIIAPEPIIVMDSGATYYRPRTYVYEDEVTTTTTYNTSSLPPYGSSSSNPPPYNPGYVPPKPQNSNCSCSGKCYILTLALAVVIGMIVYAVVMAKKLPLQTSVEIDLGLSETRIFELDSLWYRGISSGHANFSDVYQIEDDRSRDIQLLAFDHDPPVTKSDSWKYTSVLTSPPNDWTYSSWYFYYNSSIQATWTTNDEVQVTMIRSVHGYDLFSKLDSSFNNYVVYYYSGPYGALDITIPSDDFYFLIFANENNAVFSVQVQVQFSIYSMLLDTSGSTFNCTLPCEVPVCYKCNKIFVLKTPLVSEYAQFGSPDSVFTLYPKKLSRTWVVGLTFGLPLGISVFLFYVTILSLSPQSFLTVF
jgi:hypothetical protein